MNKSLLFFSIFFTLGAACYGPQATQQIQEGEVMLSYDSTLHFAEIELPAHPGTAIMNHLEFPVIKPDEHIISHTGYSFLYNETYEQAEWVAYELTKEETNQTNSRTDKFRPDPMVPTGTGNNSDYAGSHYDRGHLAPAADMGWSAIAMSESFYFSNMSPQEPGFNRGIWKQLEESVRRWAVEHERLYIVTGPVLTGRLKTIGANKIAVPQYFYKVILDYTSPDIKAIGFIIPNKSTVEPLQEYVVTIDSVEHFTGIDFFPQLPDNQEEIIEKLATCEVWSWKKTIVAKQSVKKLAITQCKGLSRSGIRCKNKTRNPSGYCSLHEQQGKRVVARGSVKTRYSETTTH